MRLVQALNPASRIRHDQAAAFTCSRGKMQWDFTSKCAGPWYRSKLPSLFRCRGAASRERHRTQRFGPDCNVSTVTLRCSLLRFRNTRKMPEAAGGRLLAHDSMKMVVSNGRIGDLLPAGRDTLPAAGGQINFACLQFSVNTQTENIAPACREITHRQALPGSLRLRQSPLRTSNARCHYRTAECSAQAARSEI